MITKKYGNILCLRLQHGEDFLEKLIEFATENKLQNAIILNGVGMLKDAEIGYFEDGKYLKKIFNTPAELVSTNGNMYLNQDNKPEWHIHVALADKTHKMIGGHILSGLVWNTAEIFIQTISGARFIRESEDGNLRLNFY
ncbi:MAG: PPC domain-containing DNA-binding protein [Candidatus Cloacimonadota bacterium]|nr:PPC domain-containing DNA-binding protein [Candidatus Cloacimonadota bacterium]